MNANSIGGSGYNGQISHIINSDQSGDNYEERITSSDEISSSNSAGDNVNNHNIIITTATS